VWNKITN